mmetsp:Transcript_32934/g.78492  ORF Transcript_32934/g.78492 Transcript_32934/m.78492 type:complete len:331 (+) Transcript_32934:789-1781(+)
MPLSVTRSHQLRSKVVRARAVPDMRSKSLSCTSSSPTSSQRSLSKPGSAEIAAPDMKVPRACSSSSATRLPLAPRYRIDVSETRQPTRCSTFKDDEARGVLNASSVTFTHREMSNTSSSLHRPRISRIAGSPNALHAARSNRRRRWHTAATRINAASAGPGATRPPESRSSCKCGQCGADSASKAGVKRFPHLERFKLTRGREGAQWSMARRARASSFEHAERSKVSASAASAFTHASQCSNPNPCDFCATMLSRLPFCSLVRIMASSSKVSSISAASCGVRNVRVSISISSPSSSLSDRKNPSPSSSFSAAPVLIFGSSRIFEANHSLT